MIIHARQVFDKLYIDREQPSDFIEFIAHRIKRELVNKLMDALKEDKLYIVQLSKPESHNHEGMYPNEMEYRQDLLREEIVQCKNCRMNFPWCQKFRDELGGNGFCPYGAKIVKEIKDA